MICFISGSTPITFDMDAFKNISEPPASIASIGNKNKGTKTAEPDEVLRKIVLRRAHATQFEIYYTK